MHLLFTVSFFINWGYSEYPLYNLRCYADLKILKATETPLIEVRFVEKADPVGPYGAKGVGEIGLVPTAGAVANAYTQFDGIRRYQLPLKIAIKPPSCQLKHE